MKFYKIIKKDKIIAELKGKSKEEVINELLDLLKNDDRISNLAEIKNAVFEREKLLSTGIGKGFAIPHCKTKAVEGIVAAFGKTMYPIEFDSIDNKPVHFVLLIASSDKVITEHLKLLSKIGNLISNDSIINKLLSSKTSEDILKVFIETEK